MGKRKSSQKAPPKQKGPPLATSFKCLFCHHDKSVSVKMDKTTMFGHLSCKVCGQKYTTPINTVDVYCDWVDACEEIRLKQPKTQRPKTGPDPLLHGAQGGAVISGISGKDSDEDEDDADDADKYPQRKAAAYDDEDDEDDEEDRGKRRRVYSDDDDDD